MLRFALHHVYAFEFIYSYGVDNSAADTNQVSNSVFKVFGIITEKACHFHYIIIHSYVWKIIFSESHNFIL